MFRIDADGAVPAQPTPQAPGAVQGYFSIGDPGTGQKATVVSQDWLNAVQETLINTILAGNQTLSKNAPYNKLTSAVRQLANLATVHSVSSADYTILDADGFGVILVTTGASDRTVTLPAASSNLNRKITVKKQDSGSGAVNVVRAGSDTIDGATSIALADQFAMVEIVSTGSGWAVVSEIIKKHFFVSGNANQGGIANDTFTDISGCSVDIPPGDYDIVGHFQPNIGKSTNYTRARSEYRLYDGSDTQIGTDTWGASARNHFPVADGESTAYDNATASWKLLGWAGGTVKVKVAIIVNGGSGLNRIISGFHLEARKIRF